MKKKFLKVFVLSLISFFALFWVAERVLDIMELTSKVEFLGHELGEGNVIEQTVENELLFLVLGMDSDDFSGHTTERNRTDTMILAKVNFETGKVDILSIPRDSRVLVDGRYDKINHAHHFGGLKLAMKTTRDFLNLDIDYYVKVNFFSVKDIVDALGGVEVDVPVQVDVNEDNVHLEPGLQVLNGKQALQFARFRAGYIDGDLGRVKAQQLLVKALLKELVKPQNIVKMPQILEVVKKTVSTNIPFSTIVKLAAKVNNLGPEKMTSRIVPGEGRYIGDISYYVPDKTALKQIINNEYKEYIINTNSNTNSSYDESTTNNYNNRYDNNNNNNTDNYNMNQNKNSGNQNSDSSENNTGNQDNNINSQNNNGNNQDENQNNSNKNIEEKNLENEDNQGDNN